MRNCFVPGCDKKAKNGSPLRPMFIVPKDEKVFAKWSEALPKLRALKKHDRVCILHFLPHEVDKSFQHIINGQTYQLERERVRLKANAVPSQNLPTSEELSQLKRLRKHAAKSSSSSVNFNEVQQLNEHQEMNGQEQTDNCQQLVPQEVVVCSNSLENFVEKEQMQQQSLFDWFSSLYDEVFEVVLPSTLWGIHRCPERSIIIFTYMNTAQFQLTKILTIESSGLVKIFLARKQINTLDLLEHLPNIKAISDLLTEIDEMSICVGATTIKDCEVVIRLPDKSTHVGVESSELCNYCLLNAIKEDEVLYYICDEGT